MMFSFLISNPFATISDKIVEFFSEVSGLTHFLNRVWSAVSSLFDYFGTLLNTGIYSVRSVFQNIIELPRVLALFTVLIPPFVVPYIYLFITVGLSCLALSMILELL